MEWGSQNRPSDEKMRCILSKITAPSRQSRVVFAPDANLACKKNGGDERRFPMFPESMACRYDSPFELERIDAGMNDIVQYVIAIARQIHAIHALIDSERPFIRGLYTSTQASHHRFRSGIVSGRIESHVTNILYDRQ